MRKNKIFIIFLLSMLFAAACVKNEVFFEYQKFPDATWQKDSTLAFYYTALDSTKTYDLYLHIRHTNEYSYQNLWLFLSENKGVQDTVELFLADEYGKWLGRGVGALREQELLYKSNVKLDTVKTIQLKIQHGMRTDNLKGIREVGLRIEKNGEK